MPKKERVKAAFEITEKATGMTRLGQMLVDMGREEGREEVNRLHNRKYQYILLVHAEK